MTSPAFLIPRTNSARLGRVFRLTGAADRFGVHIRTTLTWAIPLVVIIGCLPLRAHAAEPPAPSTRTASDASDTAPEKLDAVHVTDTRYKPAPPDTPGGKFGTGLFGFAFQYPGMSSIYPMDKVVVTATRTPQLPERVAASTRLFSEGELANTPAATLDGTLRTAPGFSLFRRSDSITANPTTQGVSLRGLGPNGASRSLVLLDGIPLNDPFGGWINWSLVPRDTVARVEVVPGGGSVAWGNAALSGAIQVMTQPPKLQFAMIDQPPAPMQFGWRGSVQTTALIGDFGTRDLVLNVTRPIHGTVFQIFGEDFFTDGFRVIAPKNRGSIDVPAWNRHRSLTARWRTPVGTKAELTATVRGFEETRGNGTPYQRNGTRSKMASLEFAAQPSDHFTWTALGYAQTQSFASTFSSIDATRTTETPASEQFGVPATAGGASWTGVWSGAQGARTSGGADVRMVRGETRENYSYANGAYTRERIAGGAQQFFGVFLQHEQPVGKRFRLIAGARLDQWFDSDGHRREQDLRNGALTRDDHYARHDGLEFSPTLGFVWQTTPAWRIRGNAQEAFRRPTLNELYRPFRQGSNVTEANAALRTEHNRSAELGAEYTLKHDIQETVLLPGRRTAKQPRAVPWFTFGATAFANDLRDAVGNVTLARGPGTFPLFGPLPAGGIGRQRWNLDRIAVRGAEFSANWYASSNVTLSATYLYDDATVRKANVAPALVGRRLAEVPRHTAALSATLRGPAKFNLTPRVRWIGRQFDDDENTLRLGEVVIVDIGLTRPITKNLEVFLNVENVGNARIETARSADGIVSTGTPRFAFGGLRGKW